MPSVWTRDSRATPGPPDRHRSTTVRVGETIARQVKVRAGVWTLGASYDGAQVAAGVVRGTIDQVRLQDHGLNGSTGRAETGPHRRPVGIGGAGWPTSVNLGVGWQRLSRQPIPRGCDGRSFSVVVAGFTLALDRLYHPETHMWVLETGPGRVTIGMDSLGVETKRNPRSAVLLADRYRAHRGAAVRPARGRQVRRPLDQPGFRNSVTWNEEVATDPGLVERDPYGAGWLIEASTSTTAGAPPPLLSEPAEITAWFTARIAHYRLNGLIAQ